MKYAALIVAGTLLSGCVGDPGNRTIVFLENPRTHDVMECRTDEGTAINLTGDVEICAATYRRLGYQPIRIY
jgi:hypothetical protein